MTERTIEVEANSLEEARQQLISQIPEGLHLLSEKVLLDGKLRTLKATADTTEKAFVRAQSQIPHDVEIIEKKELTAAVRNVITVEAFDERNAEILDKRAYQPSKVVTVKSVKLAIRGSKGLFGIGKKPHQYEVEVLQQAVVEITYKTKAKISARIGEAPTLRLYNPSHPARQQLDEAIRIVDQYVHIGAAGISVSVSTGELAKALVALETGIALCPKDMDLRVAKAAVLQVAAQFKSAEEVLDEVLSQTPDHFEAKMWKSHWTLWQSALRFPRWNEQTSSLHPVMVAHLQQMRTVQLVRDGLQKTIVLVTRVQGLPLDSRTQVKVEWVLSKTPYGPLVAYYLQIIEPSDKPSVMEAFLPIQQPSTFSSVEPYFLVQQLVFTPYYFVVLTNGNTVMLNRRIILDEKGYQQIRDIASYLSSTQTYLPLHQIQNAVQWHMAHFDMEHITFSGESVQPVSLTTPDSSESVESITPIIPDGNESAQPASPIAIKLHEIVTAMCAKPERSWNSESHAAPLYDLLPSSKIPKNVADLFIDVTIFISALTGVRTTESLEALRKLCNLKGQVVNNLLHCIAAMSDTEQTLQVLDMTGTFGSSSQTSKVSFEDQRNMARIELEKRGSPQYDIRYYANR
jgi:hypothetical protein